jgi:glycosyltransferase involved in cell wall biosynthesis
VRILFINSEYPPIGAGAGNASANLARLLVKAGNDVTVVTAGFAGLAAEESREGVQILRGPAVRGRIDRSTAWEQVVFMAGASYRCLSLMPRFRPDVVLAFFGLPSGGVAWLLNRLYGIPYVVSLRGGDVPGFRPYDFWLYHRIAVPLLRVIWRQASSLVANSSGLRELARRFDSEVEIAIVPNGVDPNLYAVSERMWSPPHILSVGRIVHQKGLDLAIKALSELQDMEWSWRVAGDGPLLSTLEHAVRERNMHSRVDFIGWQTTDQLRKEYAGSNLFLFPSRHEGMPNAVLEAMASGLPVISTRIAGNEELVVVGQTGFLVPVDDAAALREALRNLLADENKRRRMGRAARARVEQEYGWPRAATEYLSILEKASR